MAAKVLVLAVDAISPVLVDRWCADGSLPNLARLRDRGYWSAVGGLDGFFVGSTWPSLYTGTPPAQHGIHYLVQLEVGTYRLFRPAEGEFVRAAPFWRALSRAGRRLAILDVPLSRLDPEINGIQTVEWGGHDSIYGFMTEPPELAGEIQRRFGAHPVGSQCDGARTTAADYRRFVDQAVAGVRLKTELTRWVLGQEDWDLVFQTFTEGHCTGHQCWHLHDSAHPGHLPSIRAAVGDPLLAVYQAIDTAVGDLVAAAPGARVLVVAGHGMSHWCGAQFLLPEILFRLSVTGRPAADPPRSEPIRAVARSVWRGLPVAVRRWLEPLRRVAADSNQPAAPSLGVDPATSRCFVVGNGMAVGGIRLNVAGREPAGLLTPGAQVDDFVATLSADLLAIQDRRTGRPLVRRIIRTADHHTGPALDALPDVLVEWNDDQPVGSASVAGGAGAEITAWSPAIGEVAGVNPFGRTGEHRKDGFLIAAGPGIAAGRSGRAVALVDVAPTIAAWLGVTLPDAAGRPIEALRD